MYFLGGLQIFLNGKTRLKCQLRFFFLQLSCYYYDPKSRASCLNENDRLTSLKMKKPKSLFPRYQSSSPLNICSCCNSILKSNYVTCKTLQEKRRKVWQHRRTWSALRQLQLQMLTALFSFLEKKPGEVAVGNV